MTSSVGIDHTDAVYAEKLTKLPRQMVFVMGCHRSGTSLLHHLLAYTGACEYVSAYDIIKYDEILINRIEGREKSVKGALDAAIRVEKTRGLDDLPVGADYPEEYRFLLDAPMPAWWLPNADGPDVGQKIFPPQLTPANFERFLSICRKKEFLGSGDKPLILKNPNDHYFNFWGIHQLLPGARMIFIHRHPLHILNSFFAGLNGLLESRSEYFVLLDKKYGLLIQSPLGRTLLQQLFRNEQLPRILLSAFSQSYTYYLEHIQRMPRDLYTVLRYEDLCRDPEAHLREIGRFLNIRMTPTIPEKFVSPRNLKVAPNLLSAYEDRAQDMHEYLDALGYALYPEGFAPVTPATL
jgi:hypothetical protein